MLLEVYGFARFCSFVCDSLWVCAKRIKIKQTKQVNKIIT
ncbi:hypothetical protein HMPREF1573_01111 [Gardnerella vaginalis JCP7276]|nr:hypothetical protein HMPREF1573_01111 [Gardnerella vaginalis JCP7276]